jgi:hypothetical protein
VPLIAVAALALSVQGAKPMPLIHATSLAAVAGRLYAGTNSGEVHVYDARTREPITMLTSERKGVVSGVTASPNGIAWIVGNRPTSIRDKFASTEDTSTQALIFRTPDDRTYTIDLKPAGVDRTVRNLTWLGNRLWLLTDFGAAFYNTRTNAVELGTSFLPRHLAEDVAHSRVWVRDPYVMTAKPVSLRRSPQSKGLPFVSQFTVYKSEGNRWSNLGGFASNALDVTPENELSVGEDGRIPPEAKFQILSETVDFDATGVAGVEEVNLLNAPIFQENWESKRLALPGWFGEASRPDPLWVQVQGDDFWLWNGVALLKQSRTKFEGTAYLLWNDPQMLPNAFLADSAGVWIASNVGVRRIEFSTPERPMGFGGFIAIPLNAATERSENKTLEQLTRELYRWRFAPADLAGKDGARMVSEAYKAVGISIPASMQGILNASNGTIVHDELRLGDVISSSRGFAVYIGNGKTVEMRDGSVKNGTVWERPFAVVRRFIK